MCGIAGAFRIDGAPGPALPSHVLRRMADKMAHRGPDDAGFAERRGGSIAARRLSIIDVEGGHQPFANESGGIWAAQNGEIFNHEALRTDLRAGGHVLRSRCDTEVLPHLYEEHGPAFAERLRGMFAVAIWDEPNGRGVLVRDRLGIKPLYWARVGDVVLYASELKSLLASGMVGTELDHEAIAAYLTLGFVPAPLTPLKAVRKLSPGERLVVERGSMRLERWWSYPVPEPEAAPAEEWAERLLDALRDSVRMRLMSDVPLGAMLSGGLDSSLIVALMAELMDRPVQTFAVGFAGGGSELPDARRVAAALGAEHHELELELGATQDGLEDLAWHLDEPVADLSSLGFIALSRLAVQHVTVALSGQGADELLGGYRKHRVAALAGRWERLPRALRAAAAIPAAHGPAQGRRLARALQARDPVARLLASSGLVQPELRDALFGGALAGLADAGERHARTRLRGAERARPLDAALYLDAQLGLADDMLHYFDRASMACSLEVRVPFLDHEFVELCARVPQELKVHRGTGKHVLRLAAKGRVPDSVLTKRKQGFFNEQMGAWLGSGDRSVAEEVLLDGDSAYAEVIDPAVVRQAVAEWKQGRGAHTHLLVSLVMLEHWLGTVRRSAPDADLELAS
jgi:asparagine synthase (glutamine-hydrolysing)